LGWEEEVEVVGLEEDLDVVGLEDTSDDRGQEDEEEEGHEEGAALYNKGWGDGSALGSASSHRLRSSHLILPPVAPHDDNRVVIVPYGDG
jgi:hypothetical protein